MKQTKVQSRSTKDDETIKAVPMAFADEKTAHEFMEEKRWGDCPSCPECGSVNVYKMMDSKTGQRQVNFRWRCSVIHNCVINASVYAGRLHGAWHTIRPMGS